MRKRGETMTLLDVDDIKAKLGVKDTKAYEIIRKLNRELERKGYLIVRGKVPEKYFLERFYAA